MNKNALGKLSAIISALGGPPIQVEDIEWALDLPAGKKLVDWVAAQLLDEEIEVENGNNNMNCQAALRDIALEAGEVELRSVAKLPHMLNAPLASGYFPPSRISKHAEFIANETRLLEEETELLKSRLRQSKLASGAMSKTIISLQDAIAREENQIGQAQERLAELSIQGDATIQSTMDNTLSLLQSLGCTPEFVDAIHKADTDASGTTCQLASAISSLAHLASIRSSIIELHSSQLEKIEQGARRVPCAEDIRLEASQLSAALDPKFIESAQEAALKEQISIMCERLEACDAENDILQQILSDVDDNGNTLDIRGELERAWLLDQSKILQSKEKLLNATIASYKEDLMKPLDILHTFLSSADERMRNSEVLIGAFGVELEELVDDVRVAKESSQLPRPKTAGERADEFLETKLTDTLKSSQDMRAIDAPPLVLLERGDILDELRTLVATAQNLQEREEKWVKDLPLALPSLSATHTPLLSNIYEHSVVNTSPPFAFPAEVSKLQDEAEKKGNSLGDHVGRLQQELESLMESNRTKRKLAAFIDKWRKA